MRTHTYFSRLTLAVIGLFFAGRVASAMPSLFPSITITKATVNANLLPNYGFMNLDNNGVPTGWLWDSRNTQSRMEPLDTRSQFGMRSLFIANRTPFGANVYGTMWTADPIHLTPGVPCTMSCWVNLKQPTEAWIGGGDNWRIRLYFPDTHGLWKQVHLNFTPNANEAEFTFRINTDGQTNGFMIRDPKLEQGGDVTPDPPNSSISKPIFLPTTRAPIDSDQPWNFLIYVYSPKPIKNAHLNINARVPGGQSVIHDNLDVPSGLSLLTLTGRKTNFAHANALLKLDMKDGAESEAVAETSVELYSGDATRQKLLAIKKNVPKLVTLMNKAQSKKLDVSYPRVAITILQNLPDYALEMLHFKQVQRAAQMLDQMEPMVNQTRRTLEEMLSDKLRNPLTPYYVTGKIRIKGSTFYADTHIPGKNGEKVRPVIFTGWGAFDQVSKDLNILPDYGANIIQAEIGPSAVYPSEGVVSNGAIKDYITLLKRAAKANVAVNLLISPHYMPGWVMKKYPDMNVKREGFLQYSLYAPEGKEILRRFLQYLIPQIKGYPALHSICLSNEPVNAESPNDPYEQKDWHAWLTKRYENIGQLNRQWGTTYSSFDQIPTQNTMNPPPPSPIWYDYVRFNQDFFAGWHRFLADTIHSIAPNIPIHAKAMTWTMLGSSEVRYGVNAQLFGDFSQINGNDCVDFYNNGVGEWADGWQLNNMAYDLQHSVLDAPIFNSENHVMPDRGESSVPPEHLRTALWQSAIHGEGATTLWCWEETFDPKADFWGLEMERPVCVQAIGETGLDLMRLSEQVSKFQNMRPQVQILFTTAARVWDGDNFSDCLNKIYSALNFTGMKIGYITERDLLADKLPTAPLLIIPNIRHLSDPALQTLSKYKGRILAIGGKDIFGYNDYNHPRTPPSFQRLDFTSGQTTDLDLWKKLTPYLVNEHISPNLRITDTSGRRVWGVEWLTVKYHGRELVNAVNYLLKPITIKLWDGLKPLQFRNILPLHTGGYTRTIILKPLAPALLECNSH